LVLKPKRFFPFLVGIGGIIGLGLWRKGIEGKGTWLNHWLILKSERFGRKELVNFQLINFNLELNFPRLVTNSKVPGAKGTFGPSLPGLVPG